MSPDPGYRNLIVDYYGRLPRIMTKCANGSPAVPSLALPELDDATRRFYSVAKAGLRTLAVYRGRRLFLLNLMRHEQTNTAETFAALLIVARAVEHLRRTGEPMMIFHPTSANQGIALRDAVARAHEAGLATPEQLRVVVLAPARCRAKLRAGRLDPSLNPVMLCGGDDPANVQVLARRFAEKFFGRLGFRLWVPFEPANHLAAAALRAFIEADVAPTPGAPPRIHAHAVSNALGLLGYNVGRDMLEADGLADPSDRPGFLLVQHLATPDMVLSLRTGDFDRDAMPAYAFDQGSGLYKQDGDSHFPHECADPCEVLDPTFCSRRPETSTAMNDLIVKHGGDGIVVSRQECVARYGQLREWVPALPAHASLLREWSLPMAATGVLNAIDRGLIAPGHDVVIHGTGVYAAGGFTPLPDDCVIQVGSVSDIAAVLH